jgi:hypothetical protein
LAEERKSKQFGLNEMLINSEKLKNLEKYAKDDTLVEPEPAKINPPVDINPEDDEEEEIDLNMDNIVFPPV